MASAKDPQLTSGSGTASDSESAVQPATDAEILNDGPAVPSLNGV